MRYILKNSKIEATFDNFGAEMISLKDKSGKEYLWCGDSSFWPRHSPVLFPFVGKVRDGKYRYKGTEYEMGAHGFARDSEFSFVSQSEDSIWFVLESTEETKKVYPFDFRFEIGYQLVENTVRVFWKVTNTDEKEPMHFSIGAHPAFLCPLEEGEEQYQYFVKFEDKDSLIYHIPDPETALILPEDKEMILKNHQFQLQKGVFDINTFIFENKQLQEMALVTPDGRTYITVSFDTPLVALWSPNKEGSPFVCIEPWFGRSDKVGFDGSLEEREWGNTLGALEVFEAHYDIRVEE